jgi:hypothetical protein
MVISLISFSALNSRPPFLLTPDRACVLLYLHVNLYRSVVTTYTTSLNVKQHNISSAEFTRWVRLAVRTKSKFFRGIIKLMIFVMEMWRDSGR